MRIRMLSLHVMLACAAAGCSAPADDEPPRLVTVDGEVAAETPGRRGEDAHLTIVQQRLEWAREQRLDTLPIGLIVARLAETFVGTTYTPGTLDPEGPEQLVINLEELDCVTFIENVLALARMIRDGRDGFDTFREELTRIRYRGGQLAGYPSRLHYFSEWIFDNARLGLVRDITPQLGGERDTEPVNFMTSNRESYRQLADRESLEAIRRIETELSAQARHYIPQARIAAVAPQIRDGDIIAAKSTIHGLDIAHTGFALWRNGQLHLLHAPLVGSVVEISERPLAERIRGIRTQEGIMVARPL